MANSGPSGRSWQVVADDSPCSPEDVDIVVGASRAIPPDEVDEWPECPCTGPEPTTAVIAVEPTIPEPDFPTPCSTEKADEGVVSAKRLVNTLPSGWAPD